MAKIGDRFKTGDISNTTGSYAFDGYVNCETGPAPTQDERVIPLEVGGTFPPIYSSDKEAWWKLQHVG